MDTTERYKNIIKGILLKYAQLKPSHGDIRLDTFFDDTQGHYGLMQVGWDRGRRVRGNLIYITLHDENVYIEYDGIERGILQDLVANGVPEDKILLPFLHKAAA